MALLQYNGVALPYTDLTEFRQEAVYDPSNTDRILTKFVIGVQTIINKDFIALLRTDAAATPGDAVTTYQLVYNRLMAHRKQLSLKFNGVEMIPQRQQGVQGFVDAANGPRPRTCELLPVGFAGGETFVLSYSIEASYWINQSPNLQTPNANLPGNVVLYNRWSESVDIDADNRTTRNRQGKLMIRSDNNKGWIADQVRVAMALVGLPQGRFVREKSRYTVSEDGLSLAYEVVDREVWRYPPSPAMRAQGTYVEEGTRGDGKRLGTMTVKLWGGNNVLQSELVGIAAGICFKKLNSRGAKLGAQFKKLDDKDKGLPIMNRLEVGAYENWVQYTLHALYPASQQASRGAASFPDDNLRPIYLARGTGGMLLQAARYYDPSFQDTQLGGEAQVDANNPGIGAIAGAGIGGDQLSRGVEPGRAGTRPEN